MKKKATRTVPLAPPAPLGPAPPDLRQSKRKGASKKFNWTGWLSPRAPRPRPGERSQSDDDGEGGARVARPRRTSFDLSGAPSARPRVRLNVERGGAGYFAGGSSSSFGKSASSEGASSLLASKSADEAFDGPAGGGGVGHRNPRASLLTAFLFHLNSLLPEYCENLAGAADTLHSTSNAAKAVSVLERGAKTISITLSMHNTSPHSSAGSHVEASVASASSAPTSPLYPNVSPKKPASPLSDGSPSKLADARHWIYPISPRSSQQKVIGAGKPSPKRSKAKWNKAIVESEWERFIQPFVMLAGAECLYARMEHVLDPARLSKEGGGAKGDGKEGPSFVKFVTPSGDAQKKNVAAGKVGGLGVSAGDAGRRGSRRLIAMYRTIREDSIVVGEYLCDPVIGARGDGGSPTKRFPMLPLDWGQSSPGKDDANFGPNSTGDVSPRRTVHEQRELAALSLRNALDALISFIDARCVLIRLHAELCCPCPSPPMIPSMTSLDNSGAPRSPNEGNPSPFTDRKWMALADQCRCGVELLSAWAKEECATQHVVSNVEKEMKALGFALTAAHYLYESDFFNCVLNIRRLHILLGKFPTPLCFPVSYIRGALLEELAVMHIFFAEMGAALEVIRGSALGPRRLSNAPSQKSDGAKAKMQDYGTLFAEFVGRTANGPPLAAIVVRRNRDTKEPLNAEGDDKDSNAASIWEPLYMASNCSGDDAATSSPHSPDSIFARRSQPSGPNNFVRIIKENFAKAGDTATPSSSNNSAAKRGRTPSWPFQEWRGIETALTKAFEAGATETDLVKYSIAANASRSLVRSNSSNLQRRGSFAKPSTSAHCHILFITDAMFLIVVQGVGQSKRHMVSDHEIQTFMQAITSKLGPNNLLGIETVVRLEPEFKEAEEKWVGNASAPLHAHGSGNVSPSTLWSESGWSDSQRKTVLHSLGLRRKQSPVMAPLKSPYVKRKLTGRQRKKKIKSSVNHGHLELFLGQDLSHLL